MKLCSELHLVVLTFMCLHGPTMGGMVHTQTEFDMTEHKLDETERQLKQLLAAKILEDKIRETQSKEKEVDPIFG